MSHLARLRELATVIARDGDGHDALSARHEALKIFGALASAPIDAMTALEAARRAHELGDPLLAWVFAERALAAPPRAGVAEKRRAADLHLDVAELAQRAGRYDACRALCTRAAALAGGDAELLDRAANRLAALGDLDGALACVAPDGELAAPARGHPLAYRLALRAADLLLLLERPHEVRAALAPLAGDASLDAAKSAAVADRLRASGDFAGAESVYRASLARAPSAEAHAGLGELALWRGDARAAERAAEEALALASANVRARRLRAAARLFAAGAGASASADTVREIEACAAESPRDVEARIWLARARARAGDAAGALRKLFAAKHIASEAEVCVIDLELAVLGKEHFGKESPEDLAALASSPDLATVAASHARAPAGTPNASASSTSLLERARAALRERAAPARDLLAKLRGRVEARVHPERAEEDARNLARRRETQAEEIPSLSDANFDALTLDAPAATTLALLAGNRSPTPTYVSPANGALTRLTLRRSVRERAKAIQWSIRYRSPDDVLRRFDALAREVPRAHHTYAYQGELLLWLGRYADARAALLHGLELRPQARWLHIGLGAAELFEGRLDAALASFQRSTEVAPDLLGPVLFAYRGEALLRAGRLDEAAADLDAACTRTPSRVAAHATLWLVEDARKNRARREKAWSELTRRAPALVAEAVRATLGVSPIARPRVEGEEGRAVIEKLLAMLRGNRSSTCVTYFAPKAPGGRLVDRPLPAEGNGGDGGDELRMVPPLAE